METWQKIGTLAALATIWVWCSEDTIIDVDNSNHTIQYVNVDTSGISTDTIKMLIKEKQRIDSILAAQQEKIDKQENTIERQWMSLDSLKNVAAQLAEYSNMLAAIIDRNNRRQNETNAQQESRMDEIEEMLNDMDRQSQIPEKMSDETREAFWWAMINRIYEADFESDSRNIPFNSYVTKDFVTNILFKFVQAFDISDFAWKDDKVSENADWNFVILKMAEYFKDNEKYQDFINSLKFNANESIRLGDLLIFCKRLAEYLELERKPVGQD